MTTRVRPRAFRVLASLAFVSLSVPVWSLAGDLDWRKSFSSDDPAVAAVAWDVYIGGSAIYAALDGGGVVRSLDGGLSWSPLSHGLVSSRPNGHVRVKSLVLYAPEPAGCAAPCRPPGKVYAGTAFDGVFRLEGTNWINTSDGLTDASAYSLAVDQQSGVAYAVTPSGVFRSVVSGPAPEPWVRAGDIPDGSVVSAVVSLPGLQPAILAGTASGIFRSTDGGSTWAKTQGLQNYQVTSFVVDPLSPGIVYAGTAFFLPSATFPPDKGSILRSLDGGRSWKVVTPAYLNVVQALAAGPGPTGTAVYAGTTTGIVLSQDAGATWSKGGLTGYSVTSVVSSPLATRELFAGTRFGSDGGGVFQADSVTPACPADAVTLCLHLDRFQVVVSFDQPLGGGGAPGRAIPVTSDSGAFWFFESSSVELTVKVVDGRSVNGHFWIFYSGMTNLAYTISVTDNQTGAIKTYTNPSGQFASVADTQAF